MGLKPRWFLGALNLEEAKAFIRKDFIYIRSSNHLYNCVGHIECSQMKCKKHPLDERYYVYETGNHGQIMSKRRGIPHNIKKHFDHLVFAGIQPRNMKRALIDLHCDESTINSLTTNQIANRRKTLLQTAQWDLENSVQWGIIFALILSQILLNLKQLFLFLNHLIAKVKTIKILWFMIKAA